MSLLTKSSHSSIQTAEVASEQTSEMIEFRCTRCWQSNTAKCELTGNTISCRNCGHETTVPEATPDRIARAQALLQEEIPPLNPYSTMADRGLSNREITALAEKESRVPLHENNFSGYSLASIGARLFAQFIDGFFFAMTMLAGIGGVLLLTKQGYIEKDGTDWTKLIVLSLTLVPPALLVLAQWTLLALHGQTIGKKFAMIRVVTMRGRLPGFFQGVFLRNWLRIALSFIPFFGLIDLLFGLGASRRCIHDLLSGTRVVETN